MDSLTDPQVLRQLQQDAQARGLHQEMIPMYSDIQEEKTEARFLEQLNPDKINEYIENKLRGKYFDSQKKQWNFMSDDSIVVSKRITEEGVSEIMTRIWSIINPNTIYSDLDEDTINLLVIDFGIELSRFLSLRYRSFNMDLLDINKITNFCCNMAYMALRRGKEGWTLRMMRTMIQSKELSTSAIRTEGKKISNPFNIFKKS